MHEDRDATGAAESAEDDKDEDEDEEWEGGEARNACVAGILPIAESKPPLPFAATSVSSTRVLDTVATYALSSLTTTWKTLSGVSCVAVMDCAEETRLPASCSVGARRACSTGDTAALMEPLAGAAPPAPPEEPEEEERVLFDAAAPAVVAAVVVVAVAAVVSCCCCSEPSSPTSLDPRTTPYRISHTLRPNRPSCCSLLLLLLPLLLLSTPAITRQ